MDRKVATAEACRRLVVSLLALALLALAAAVVAIRDLI